MNLIWIWIKQIDDSNYRWKIWKQCGRTLDHFGSLWSLDVSGQPVKGALIIELVDVDRLKKRQTLEVVKMAGQAGQAMLFAMTTILAMLMTYNDLAT